MYSREELLCGQINTGNNPAFMKHTQAEPELSSFLLVIGIGGTGIKAVRRAAGRLRREMTDRSHVSFLAIDRDRTELEGLEEDLSSVEVEQPFAYAVTNDEYELYLLEVFDLTRLSSLLVEPPAEEGI